MSQTIITAHLLRHALTCERRVWLDAQGDPALRVELPETTRLMELGILHEQQIHETTAPRIEPVPLELVGGGRHPDARAAGAGCAGPAGRLPRAPDAARPDRPGFHGARPS